ncbi:MAG: SUF system NifU family Fe-S cluster assembly protein [Planctomycetes bacterium]|nr:SUF system NifU family Fe-S cluster assembly protein [Planctomycetota bacterium]
MFSEEEEIYQEHVLDHYEDPYHNGTCDHATHAHEDDNPLCGDVVRIELQMEKDGRVKEAWFEGDGCVISQASASMLIEMIEGQSVAEVQAFSAKQMLELFSKKKQLTPNRQNCCLLSWKVLQKAIHSPLADDDEVGAPPIFSGPDLGEES